MTNACACLAGTAAFLVLAGCGSGGGYPAPPILPPPVATAPADTVKFDVLTTRTLDADGEMTGHDAHELIRDFSGDYVPGPIETPDLYPINHTAVRHIYEDSDAIVGNHFVFTIHRDLDIDRNRTDKDDRQRNEIKVYDKSADALKGYENATFIYRWKFRINDDMEVSRRFTHLFQLKAVGGDASQPIVTISGAERSGEDGIEVRFSSQRQDSVLQRQDWSIATGEWLEAYCRVTFAESGDLRLIVTRMSDGQTVFDIDERDLDLWRGADASHYVRPKWGIYRSILDRDNLRAEEETVRFANFSISEVVPAT